MQWVSTRLLTALWRIGGKTDVRSSFGEIGRFGLWKSPTGLYFFDPPREGDHLFYSRFYAWLKSRGLFDTEALREEFFLTAAHIPPGANVLDVGSGRGAFRQCLPQANYTGLDPHFAGSAVSPDVRNETLAQHLADHEARYDAVCCFHVIEHVSDPKALFGEILRAVKPGGLVCISVPHVPSATTRIPNFLNNAPPHHLTWWTKNALIELASGGGAVVESVENVPWGKADSLIYWMARCSPIKCTDVYFRGRGKWYFAMVVSFVLGTMAFRLFGAPRKMDDEGAALLLLARRPAAGEIGAR